MSVNLISAISIDVVCPLFGGSNDAEFLIDWVQRSGECKLDLYYILRELIDEELPEGWSVYSDTTYGQITLDVRNDSNPTTDLMFAANKVSEAVLLGSRKFEQKLPWVQLEKIYNEVDHMDPRMERILEYKRDRLLRKYRNYVFILAKLVPLIEL